MWSRIWNISSSIRKVKVFGIMKYGVTIGMEVHAELKTASKMFCSCKNGLGLESEPNVNICPVCTGQPGSNVSVSTRLRMASPASLPRAFGS